MVVVCCLLLSEENARGEKNWMRSPIAKDKVWSVRSISSGKIRHNRIV